jgi:GNAT superfamily N-acetyltransferase
VRELRLRALADAPDAFGSTLDGERAHGETEGIGVDRGVGRFEQRPVRRRGRPELGGDGRRLACRRRSRRAPVRDVVEPLRRSNGIGASLVEQVLGWARTWDARSVILAVTESNTGGAAFYEHLGFVDTSEREPLREGSELRVRILRREL